MNPDRELPPTWSWALFGEVATVSTNLVNPARYQSLPHIAPNHIESRIGRLLPFNTVAEDGVISSNHLFRRGQILYSKIRPYLAKAAEAPFDGLCSADMYPIDTALLPRFLLYWLLTPEFTQLASQLQGRTVLPKINRAQLESLPVPVAPLREQSRIVAAVEEQFSRLEFGVAALERASQGFATFTRRIVLAAIPEIWPEHWRRAKIGDAGSVALGRQRSPQYHSGPKMRHYLRVANVFEDRIDTKDVMSMHFDDDEYARYVLRPGDVLLNEGQSPHLLGRPAMYRGDPPDVAFTNSLIRFRAGPDVLPSWALLVFRHHLHSKRFMQESQITTNIAHLSAGRFKDIEFPVPPIDEQEMLIKQTEALLSEAGRMAVLLKTQRVRATALRNSILDAAFSGKLVAQDISDEPAAVLIRRLSTELASADGRGVGRVPKPRPPREQVTA